MSGTHTKFYLDKQNAKWKGVCAGIADYTGVNVLWVRLGTVFLTLMGGFPWTLIAYWGAAWMADKKPIHLYTGDQEEQKFWQGVRQSPARTTRDIRSRFREIDRRLADIEIFYTSNNKQLADEIESLR
jgi:phage shock protein C